MNQVHYDSMSESEHLSSVIGAIYDAALEPDLWSEALRLSTGFLDGVAANLFWQSPVDHSASVFHSWGDHPDFVASYFERYAALNPLFPAATFVEPGLVFSGGDIVPHDEFMQTRFFREWVDPQGFVDVVGVNLHRFAVGVATFSVRRSRAQGYVDDVMRRKTALLAPHVQRALMIGREIERHREQTADLESVLSQVTAGVFLVDGSGQIGFANAAAREILERGDMLLEKHGTLHASDPSANQLLRAALVAAAESDVLSLRAVQPSMTLRDAKQERYLAHVLPLASGNRQRTSGGSSARVALFVRRAEIPIMSGAEILAQQYRLTAGEVRVLLAVVATGSREEIAEALGLSVSTVKTHLAALFDKTGTRRRADLVKLVAAHSQPLR